VYPVLFVALELILLKTAERRIANTTTSTEANLLDSDVDYSIEKELEEEGLAAIEDWINSCCLQLLLFS
jgi:hypothetical protein